MSDETQSKTMDCPDCGGTVSKRAVSCPHCGAPIAADDAPVHTSDAVVPTNDINHQTATPPIVQSYPNYLKLISQSKIKEEKTELSDERNVISPNATSQQNATPIKRIWRSRLLALWTHFDLPPQMTNMAFAHENLAEGESILHVGRIHPFFWYARWFYYILLGWVGWVHASILFSTLFSTMESRRLEPGSVGFLVAVLFLFFTIYLYAREQYNKTHSAEEAQRDVAKIWGMYIAGGLLSGGALMALCAFAIEPGDPLWGTVETISAGYLLMLLPWLYLGRCWLYNIVYKTEFVLTNKRLLTKTGFWRTVVREIQLQQVESLDYGQIFLERWLNVGRLTVRGTGGGKVRTFGFLVDSVEFRKKILDQVDKVSSS